MIEDYDQDFVFEAIEMIESAQGLLLEIESGNTSSSEQILRVFHTLKGAFGMFGLVDAEKAFHFFEDLYLKESNKHSFSNEVIDYLLKGLDITKDSLQARAPFRYALVDPNSANQTKSQLQNSNPKTVTKMQVSEQVHVDNSVHHLVNDKGLHEYKVTRHGKYIDDSFGKEKKPLIYIIEDNEDIRALLMELVAGLDFESKGYEDPVAALEHIASDDPDLIITDINMPNMDGMEFISKIYPMFPHLPVIICSGHVTKQICIEFLSFGAAGIIEKPFKSSQLRSMIEHNVNRYRAYRLLGRSIRYMQYQFSDLEKFLQANGLESICSTLRNEMQEIMLLKRKIDRNA